MNAKKGSFTCPASTGNFSVTGLGFTPDAVIFFYTTQTATGYTTGANLGVGFMTSSTQTTNAVADKNATSPVSSPFNNNTDNALCIFAYGSAGASTAFQASRVSMGADGFTVNFSNVTSGAIIHYLAIQGVSNAKAAKTLSLSSGNQSITGVGFKPDLVIAAGHGSDATITIGAATSATTRAAAGWTGGTGTGNIQANQRQLSTKLFTIAAADADYASADLVTMDADGFTVNLSTANATTWMYLALKGGTLSVGTDTQKTSTGTQSKVGLGAVPAGVLFISANAASSSSIQTSGAVRMSIGATDATTGGATWIDERGDGTATTASDQRTTTSAALSMSSGTATTNAEASISTMDSDGYTLNWTTADATAREFIYIGFGGNPPNPIGGIYGIGHGGAFGLQLGQAVSRAANW